ncbi:uncharacterized protein PV07_06771 [Cladophialophora immunda]|uniref:Uncharacterized protein n=1 Tax=Cladophialophora immunda TaxID=569365 RepID=A0A0D2CTR6_9EURO|nr:uncharacterized protein PV07_06771 [Cladophialophora immunda]KIW26989.1 hypothetical protein PV07_06771 [Cladophialophora immunda]
MLVPAWFPITAGLFIQRHRVGPESKPSWRFYHTMTCSLTTTHSPRNFPHRSEECSRIVNAVCMQFEIIYTPDSKRHGPTRLSTLDIRSCFRRNPSSRSERCSHTMRARLFTIALSQERLRRYTQDPLTPSLSLGIWSEHNTSKAASEGLVIPHPE